MKTTKFIPLLLSLIIVLMLLSGCGPGQIFGPTLTNIPTNTSTFTPTSTSLPSPTNTPVPTPTSEPSPTPIVLPELIKSLFTNLSIIYHDEFNYVTDNMIPQGWESSQRGSIWITKKNNLLIQPNGSGEWDGPVVHFTKEIISPNTGIYFTFKFIGMKQNFTLGIDSVTEDGELIPGKNSSYASFAMQDENNLPRPHFLHNNYTQYDVFKGNLPYMEDNWYDIIISIDDKGNYLMKIWDPNDTTRQLSYIKNRVDLPKYYFFTTWIAPQRSLYIDDFTIIRFTSIVQ
jgi:hypothetical protein